MAFFFFTNSLSNIKKIKSFSHGEFKYKKLMKKKIEKKILKNKDIFNRGYKIKKIELDE